MPKTPVLLPLFLLALAASPVRAQDVPTVLFCKGQCYGVTDKNERIPLNKGTQLAPGLRLETAPGSYLQVKLDADHVCALSEGAALRLAAWRGQRDVLVLERGRIRLIGGEAIGRPGLRPVELQTKDGTITLRSADVEVKVPPVARNAPPAPVLVKLNVGDAKIGGIALPTDTVRGITGGKVLEQPVAIDKIAPETTVKLATSTQTTTFQLPTTETKLPTFDLALSPELQTAVVGTREVLSLTDSTALKTSTLSSSQLSLAVSSPTVYTQVTKDATVLPGSTLLLAQPIETSTGTTSLNTLSKTMQLDPSTTTTLRSTTLSSTVTLQSTTTSTSTTTILSPKLTTTTLFK